MNETPRFTVHVRRMASGRRKYYVFDDNFGFDASLEVKGDFGSPGEAQRYVEAIAAALNAADIPIREEADG